MNLNLKGKIAFVSGSSRGIGKAIAATLASEGCSVYLNGRDAEVLRAAVEEIQSQTGNPDVHGICCDITQSAEIKSALAQIQSEKKSHPELVVASVGSGRSVVGWDVTDEEWERMFSLNFLGATRLVREAVRGMQDLKRGSIVCISSIAGCDALPAPIPYSTAKAALLSFVKNTSDAVAKLGVRVNAVSPGNVYFEGSTWERKMHEDKAAVMDYINRVVPMQDFAVPQDIADMTAFLLSEKARFVTGTNFVVDGGQARKYL